MLHCTLQGNCRLSHFLRASYSQGPDVSLSPGRKGWNGNPLACDRRSLPIGRSQVVLARSSGIMGTSACGAKRGATKIKRKREGIKGSFGQGCTKAPQPKGRIIALQQEEQRAVCEINLRPSAVALYCSATLGWNLHSPGLSPVHEVPIVKDTGGAILQRSGA